MSPLGIITEDKTDEDTIRTLVRRTLQADGRRAPRMPGFSPSTGGCAKVRQKTEKWIRELTREGCEAIVLVHDLDLHPQTGQLNDEAELRQRLSRLVGEGLRHVCIPVEEIEAWFWSDPELVKRLGRGHGKAHLSPDRIRRPKEELRSSPCGGGGSLTRPTRTPSSQRASTWSSAPRAARPSPACRNSS